MQEISREKFCQKLRSAGFAAAFLSAAAGSALESFEHFNGEIFEPFRQTSFLEADANFSGRYFLEHHGPKDQVDEAISKSNFFAAFSLEVQPSHLSDSLAGDHESLVRSLAGTPYLRLRREYESLRGASIEIFLIPVASDPQEIESVVGSIRDNAMFFFFPDETREFHVGNCRWGNGFRLQKKA
ncbi:hypothetical protein [Marinobacter litoralis]|uniref:hypothetical protein n=1 Tax=Marinobacter litoralis TaxID=187981 RepID=UPI0018ECB3C3|nr:hypothetical protein [Marinobacter litoralis]MBJ6137853.1 hypothetical protein [Marinobacter litoralis]